MTLRRAVTYLERARQAETLLGDGASDRDLDRVMRRLLSAERTVVSTMLAGRSVRTPVSCVVGDVVLTFAPPVLIESRLLS